MTNPRTSEQQEAYEKGFYEAIDAREKGVYKARECWDRCPYHWKEGGMAQHALGKHFIQGWKDGG